MLLIGSIDISKRMLDQIINLLESLGILNIDLHYSIAFDLQVSIGLFLLLVLLKLLLTISMLARLIEGLVVVIIKLHLIILIVLLMTAIVVCTTYLHVQLRL